LPSNHLRCDHLLPLQYNTTTIFAMLASRCDRLGGSYAGGTGLARVTVRRVSFLRRGAFRSARPRAARRSALARGPEAAPGEAGRPVQAAGRRRVGRGGGRRGRGGQPDARGAGGAGQRTRGGALRAARAVARAAQLRLVTHAAAHVECVEAIFAAVPTV
jgi:hypothetical protein